MLDYLPGRKCGLDKPAATLDRGMVHSGRLTGEERFVHMKIAGSSGIAAPRAAPAGGAFLNDSGATYQLVVTMMRGNCRANPKTSPPVPLVPTG